MRYLVTGGAGFVGSHLVERLLARGDEVICLDNFNDYYAPDRKRNNIQFASQQSGYTLIEGDIRDGELIASLFENYKPQKVAHLAAMAGPRPSIKDPMLYEQVNVAGTVNLLEQARRHDVQAFLLASTSSVYGASPTPWREDESDTNHPLSPYAATKKACEVLAYTFHQIYKMPTTVVRFFTVYGPRGRPDMTPHLFVNKMVKGEPFTLFNGGDNLYRDYTYVADIVSGVVSALDKAYPYEIFNLGNATPVLMRTFVEQLEEVTGLKALIDAVPLPATDPSITFADTSKAQRMLDYKPQTHVLEGLEQFWKWYKDAGLDRR